MRFRKGGSPAEKVNDFFQKGVDFLEKGVDFLEKGVHFFTDGDLVGRNGQKCIYMQTAVHENTCPRTARHLAPGASSASSAPFFPI